MAEVLIVDNESVGAKIASDIFIALIKEKPAPVLGLATGSTPLKVYELLADTIKREQIDVSDVSAFALDEYIDIKDQPQSYHNIIQKFCTEPLQLSKDNVHVPDGNSVDHESAANAYEELIRSAGGIDLQILGIGTDGHIGFNEPGSSLASRTRIKTLTKQTRKDNARFFDNDMSKVPVHCITQGIGTILEAEHIILLAFGESKAGAVAAALEGGVSSSCPASALQMHPHVTVILDSDAASLLKYREYYDYAYQSKPHWQRF